MRQAGEPSVEEILESIKKVIARDNRAGAAVERKEREERGIARIADEPAPEPEADEDILELGELAEEFDDGAADEPLDSPLLTDTVASSMRESLAALAVIAEPGAQPQIVRSGETSLEGMARELLRPALAQWLDVNLPPMVERLVAAEISRIVGKKG
jgi:cell pole-organizing protein PopZ